MGFNTGLEAIDFQHKSKLAQELIDVFQSAIDVRQKVKETTTSAVKIAYEVEHHFFKITAPSLAAIILKHTGIPVGKLYVSKTFSIMFACTVDFDKDEGLNMYTTIQRYCGLEIDSFVEEYIASKKDKMISPDEIAKLAVNLDTKTGKMAINKLAGKDIKFLLFFDYNAAFLAKESAHVKCEYMTAEEIAAIVLHEVGHMITMFEHASDAYFRANVYNKVMINGFIKKAGKFDLIYYGLDFLDSKFPAKKQAIDALRAKVKTHEKNYTGDQTKSVPVFISLLYSLFYSMLVLICSLLFAPFRLFEVLSPMITTLENNTKLSDYATLKKQDKYCEQLADEFVSRHGMAAGLNSGLQKIFTWVEVTGLGSMVAHNSSLAWTTAKIPFFILTMFYGDLSSGGGSYDREYDRIVRAMNNMLTVFKSEDMSKEALDFYINDYEMCKATIANYNKHRRLTEAMYVVHNSISYLLTTPLDLIFTGRFLSEYNKLHDKAEMLIANSIGYHSAKLKQLISSK